MNRYSNQSRLLVAVDCIIFGFDGAELKILLVKRGREPEKGNWSLMGGFVRKNESIKDAAGRVLVQLTGLEDIYMEQLHTFGELSRDPMERTVSVAYFSLLDLTRYRQQLSPEFEAEWFTLAAMPSLIFDHEEMVKMAKDKLKYKASIHPILFELLSDKFTLPVLQTLFEQVYDTEFDKRNFSRKIQSTGLLLKLKEKDKLTSKKGAFFYKLNKKNYRANFNQMFRLIPNMNELI